MITLDNIKKLNSLELEIYHFVNSHKKEIVNMKLKDVATHIHVSPSMITRVSQKLGYQGFVEWRTEIKMEKDTGFKQKERTLNFIIDYFRKVDNKDFENEIHQAVEMIVGSREVLFFGVGISATIAKMGAYTFNRKGVRSTCFEDFSMRLRGMYNQEDCAIVLTVSGKTEEILQRINGLKSQNIKVIVITNSATSPAAKMADLAICYYVPSERNQYFYSNATQVPVIYILESIAESFIEYGIY